MNKPDHPPLQPKQFTKMAKEWADVILMGESGTWIWPVLNAPYRRILQFQQDRALQEMLFGDELGRQLFIYVDLKQANEISIIQLHEILLRNLIDQTKEKISKVQLKDAVHQISKIEKNVSYFICGLDQCIKNNRWDIIEELNALATSNQNIHILLFVETDLTDPVFIKQYSKRTTLAQNIFITPLYSKEDADAFIKYLSTKWSIKINKDQYMWIINNCGGHYLLIKEVIRQLKKEPSLQTDKIPLLDTLQLKAEMILNQLTEEQKSILSKVISKRIMEINSHTLQFLIKQGWILKKGLNYEISVPYIGQILLLQNNIVKKPSLSIIYTKLENTVFLYLVKNLNQILSRTQVAQIIWEEEWEEHYSDWAIDQLIHKIRVKMDKANAPYQLITKKGEGFVLISK